MAQCSDVDSVLERGAADTRSQTTIDLSNWMRDLDERLHTVPLNRLAIPGSHNSCMYILDKNGPVSPDEPQAIVDLVKTFGTLAKGILYNWSMTQTMNAKQQLNAGIRYFDIRLASRPGSTDLFCVHGLYGPTIETVLDDVSEFMELHPKEIVLLDFKAFYNVDQSSHNALMDHLTGRFGSLMAPVIDLSSLTLSMMWDTGLQLVVFYHHHDIPAQRFQFWPGCSIASPWANTTDISFLLRFLTENIDHGRPDDRFYVSQGVLTPDVRCIVMHLGQNLRDCLAKPLAPRFVDWLEGRSRKGGVVGGVNICLLDFVEMAGYVEKVVALNSGQAIMLGN